MDPYRGSMRMGDPQSFNRYAYVENDPINFTDPSGLLLAGPNTRYSNITISGVINESVTVVDSYDASISFFGGSVFGRVVEAGLDPGGGFVDYGGGEIGDFGGILPAPQDRVDQVATNAINSILRAPKELRDTVLNNKKDIQSRELTLCHAGVESTFNPDAVGFQDEIGLFQIKLSTTNDLGLGTFTRDQLFDPALNTQLGTTHLQNLINSFGGDVRTALGAYKQGEFGVRRND